MNKETLLTHAYSFAKTFVTVFLGIYIFGLEQNQEVFTTAFLLSASKASLASVIRNIYKLITEK